jgi:ketosteroid isomerase-like protein
MRNHLATAALTSVLVTACSADLVTRPPPPPVDWRSLDRPPAPDAGARATAKERAVAKVFAKALASPGLAELGPLLDEEAHLRFAGSTDVRGREKVVRALDSLLGAFDERSFVISRVLLTDSAQVVEWTMAGVHKAARKAVTIKGLALLWTRDDGSISDIHLYFDEAVLKAQIGEGPPALRNLRPMPAPSRPPQEVEQERSPEESAHVALARDEIQALEDNNEAAYLATMTDDVEVITLESAEPSRGKAAARAYFRAMRGAIGHLDTEVENAWGIGPFVAIEYSISGEQRKPIGWVIPARNDALIKMGVVDVIETREGKIARVWRYDNPARMVSALASKEQRP